MRPFGAGEGTMSIHETCTCGLKLNAAGACSGGTLCVESYDVPDRRPLPSLAVDTSSGTDLYYADGKCPTCASLRADLARVPTLQHYFRGDAGRKRRR
jgi:hypothetical protein